MKRVQYIVAAVALTFSLSVASSEDASGQVPNERVEPRKTAAAKQNPPPRAAVRIDAERERHATAFVADHHSELGTLLTFLKERRPAEYQRAILEVANVAERLDRLKQRDREKYAIEVEIWKLNSRAKLVAAKIKLGKESGLEQELKGLIREQMVLRRANLELDRRRVQERQDKLNEQIARIDAQIEDEVERQYSIMTQGKKGRKENADGNSAVPTTRKTIGE